MLDRDVGLARPIPKSAAYGPAARKARIECQGTINQRHHGADVLTESGQRKGDIREDARVVSAACKAVSITPAALDATLAWRSKTSSSEPSKRAAHKCAPVIASISCPVIRTRFPAFRTEPSRT